MMVVKSLVETHKHDCNLPPALTSVSSPPSRTLVELPDNTQMSWQFTLVLTNKRRYLLFKNFLSPSADSALWGRRATPANLVIDVRTVFASKRCCAKRGLGLPPFERTRLEFVACLAAKLVVFLGLEDFRGSARSRGGRPPPKKTRAARKGANGNSYPTTRFRTLPVSAIKSRQFRVCSVLGRFSSIQAPGKRAGLRPEDGFCAVSLNDR